jgi:hypothetical protein
LATGDINRDERPDVLLLTAPRGDSPPELVVYLNDGTGSLDVAGAIVIPVADVGRVLSFALVDADYDDRKEELLLATDDNGVHLSTIDLSAGTHSPRQLTADSGNRLVAGDFDGDGLVDFALASSTSVRVYRNQPLNP